MTKSISTKDLSKLLSLKLVKENEVVFLEGSMIIAEDPITKSRRIVDAPGLMLESSKKVLLG